MSLTLSQITSPTTLWFVLAIVFGIWIGFSWVLYYHWRSYAKKDRDMNRARNIYFSISILFFILEVILITSL